MLNGNITIFSNTSNINDFVNVSRKKYWKKLKSCISFYKKNEGEQIPLIYNEELKLEDGNVRPILIRDSVKQFSKDSETSNERCVSNDTNISSQTPLTSAECDKSEEKERNTKIYD